MKRGTEEGKCDVRLRIKWQATQQKLRKHLQVMCGTGPGREGHMGSRLPLRQSDLWESDQAGSKAAGVRMGREEGGGSSRRVGGWFTDTVSGQSAVRSDTSDQRTNIIVTIQKYSQWYVQYDKHFWKNNTFCIRHSTSLGETAWNTTTDVKERAAHWCPATVSAAFWKGSTRTK